MDRQLTKLLTGANLDSCPNCHGSRITDSNMDGCELANGQRWHVLCLLDRINEGLDREADDA